MVALGLLLIIVYTCGIRPTTHPVRCHNHPLRIPEPPTSQLGNRKG